MQDPALALIAICGFSVICIGLLVIVGFLVLRFTGRTVGDLLGGGGLTGAINSLSGVGDPDEDGPLIERRRRRQPTKGNLRAQAQSLDFDSAVAKYKSQPPQSGFVNNNPFPPSQPTFEDSTDLSSTRAQDRKRRRRLKDAEEGDELFEPFMDDDDGIL
jgi:hypothetical protein